jgi:hypothetical protein
VIKQRRGNSQHVSPSLHMHATTPCNHAYSGNVDSDHLVSRAPTHFHAAIGAYEHHIAPLQKSRHCRFLG